MALLTRGPRKSPKQPESVEDSRMSVIEHLEALRRALIVSLVGLAAMTLIAWFFSNTVFTFLQQRGNLHNVIYLEPTGGFFIRFKIALYLGGVLASPVIFWQMWWFVSPGLYSHEKKAVLPLVGATTFFFLLGIGFALYALPFILRVLGGFAPPGVVFTPTADAVLSFVLAIVLGFGVVFELPVILWVLGTLRIISSRWLYHNRAYWIIGLGLLANVLTPGADPLTPLIMFVPLYIFFEGTALLLKLSGK